MMKSILYLVLLFSFYGCASFNAVKYSNESFLQNSPKNIRVFQNFPPQEFEKLGEVSGEGAQVSNRESMVEKLKQMAADMGGDALVLSSQEVFAGMVGNVQNYGYGNSYSSNMNAKYVPIMNGVVIKFKTLSNEVSYFINRGNVLGKSGKCKEAINDFNKALELSPESFEAYNGRGICYGMDNMFEKSLEDLRKALLLNPKEEAAININIANIYEKMGDLEGALHLYKQVVLKVNSAEAIEIRSEISKLEKKLNKK